MSGDQTAPKYLSKSSPGQTRTFSIPVSSTKSRTIARKSTEVQESTPVNDAQSEDKSVQINITELALSADNLSHETWASSYILASLIHRLDVRFPEIPSAINTEPRPETVIPVVELGAGTGLVGLTAATCWNQRVVLTDLAPIVPGLKANVDVNAALLNSVGDKGVVVDCGTLDWVRPDQLILPSADGKEEEVFELSSTKAHVLLAADTCYSTEHPRLLSGVILKWLRRHPEARVVLGTALRVAYLDEITELWNRLEEGGMEVVAQGQEEAREQDFDDERLVEWSLWRWRGSSLTDSAQ
ncbi:hypothetical protein MBLNU457_4670t1 [Dothideomycetes sp. NU457]